MKLQLRHRTCYRYPSPADLGPHIVRLHPAAHTRARVLSYNLEVLPDDALVRWQHDPWGNRVARLTFPAEKPIDALELAVDLTLDIRPVNPFDFFIDDRSRELPMRYADGLDEELERFRRPPEPGPRLAEFVETVPARGLTVGFLVELCRLVAARVRYIIRNEPGVQTSEETLSIGSGSCRDSAVLLVDVLRARGFAARFASGYLIQLADEGIIPDLPRGVSADVLDLHAWAEAYVPGAGWIGLDGTSGLLCGEGHIPLACSTEHAHAAPVAGSSSVAASAFEFEMDVARLGHEPTPRRPYSDEQWDAIRAAGRDVDGTLERHGVALTMGGEPTWTSREHAREDEWLTEALGPTKWSQGLRFARELRSRLAPGAVAMHRMGKLYPGESLPRWALDILWRADGVPVWRDAALLDFVSGHDDEGVGARGRELERLLELSRRFAETLADVLGVPANIQPGFEDPWHFIREEMDLPLDVDPLTADLDDPEARRRLARVLGRGLGTAVGFALPLGRTQDGWRSSVWTFRRGHIFLLPGESPMGLRLPLDRIGGTPDELPPRDPSLVEGELPQPEAWQPAERRAVSASEGARGDGSMPQVAGGDPRVVRTALCVEPRDSALGVFLPPTETAEAFFELVNAVESVAGSLGQPVRIEGYGPPDDHRVRKCVVTPDPGVLEVNMPVTRSFDEYVETFGTIADAANHAGLLTEKYQLDGREVGSGGGHHITLGGPTPLESPFIKRPELLGSLLRYLQNHPSLSYLFTGLFVGPTSQAPRVDEARHESLYELELALSQMPASGGGRTPPWLVDRLLRNILIDVAGNTHRTEVSIDKLYDPATSSGRQGIVELRAFEMPPHERMAAAQMLLARSLVARFATSPYTTPLVRWGTELHDRFLLPHYLWRDFEDVADDLRRHGVPIEAEWYQPFLDYRFPVMGDASFGDVRLELRMAGEPWMTLGDETTGATVSRYVDSSLERVQVRVDGMTAGRHIVAVNGVRLPLRRTGRASELVAGVRFRAWQPPHCLQPNIPIHHPLRFDVVDTWGERSIGSCAYHVWHPEGRAFDEPPLTLFEAAARRAQRFSSEGHTPWPVALREPGVHPEAPFTLDLRRMSVEDTRESRERG